MLDPPKTCSSSSGSGIGEAVVEAFDQGLDIFQFDQLVDLDFLDCENTGENE